MSERDGFVRLGDLWVRFGTVTAIELETVWAKGGGPPTYTVKVRSTALGMARAYRSGIATEDEADAVVRELADLIGGGR